MNVGGLLPRSIPWQVRRKIAKHLRGIISTGGMGIGLPLHLFPHDVPADGGNGGGGDKYEDKVLGYNPIFLYKCDEAGGGVATDATGNGYHGTIGTGATYQQAGPDATHMPYSILLDNTDDGDLIAPAASMTDHNPLHTGSVMFWLYLVTDADANAYYWGIHDDNYADHLYRIVAYKNLVTARSMVTSMNIRNLDSTTKMLSYTTWTHFVYSWHLEIGSDPPEIELYIDAVPDGTLSQLNLVAEVWTPNRLAFGQKWNGSGPSVVARWAYCSLFDTQLSQADVSDLFVIGGP